MSYPIHPYAKIEIEQINDIRTSKSRYYRNRARGNKSSYFMLAITSPAIPYAEFVAYSAQIEALEGELSIFTLPNPLPPLASFSGHTVATTANQGVKQITIDTASNYRVGDFVQFAGHAKVYRISGVAQGAQITLTLSCPLVETVTAGTAITYGADVEFQLCMTSNYSATTDAKNSKFGVITSELIEQA